MANEIRNEVASIVSLMELFELASTYLPSCFDLAGVRRR